MPLLTNEYVFQLEIPMDNISIMTVVDCTNKLLEIVPCLFFRKSLFSLQELFELATFHILHHNNHFHILQSIAVDDFYNIWVTQSFHILCLSKDHIDVWCWTQSIRLQHLNCYFVLCVYVLCEGHSTKSTFANQPDDLILSEIFIWVKLLSFTDINGLFILYIGNVRLLILDSLRRKQPNFISIWFKYVTPFQLDSSDDLLMSKDGSFGSIAECLRRISIDDQFDGFVLFANDLLRLMLHSEHSWMKSIYIWLINHDEWIFNQWNIHFQSSISFIKALRSYISLWIR